MKNLVGKMEELTKAEEAMLIGGKEVSIEITIVTNSSLPLETNFFNTSQRGSSLF